MLHLEGRAVPLRMRRNPRARRLILRIDPDNDGVIVTLPEGVSPDAGLDLAQRKAGWIIAHLDRLAPPVAFRDGAVIPILGTDHQVRHDAEGRGGVYRQGQDIIVMGRPEHLARRLADWLRREARREITARTREKAAKLGRKAGRITLRNTRSRWGSCSASGDLSFCWRLILAPEPVLDYVVAHEVAHLAHANHGVRFWRAVAGLVDDVDPARAWLRRNGEALHRFG